MSRASYNTFLSPRVPSLSIDLYVMMMFYSSALVCSGVLLLIVSHSTCDPFGVPVYPDRRLASNRMMVITADAIYCNTVFLQRIKFIIMIFYWLYKIECALPGWFTQRLSREIRSIITQSHLFFCKEKTEGFTVKTVKKLFNYWSCI